jgi:hypothetical protein
MGAHFAEVRLRGKGGLGVNTQHREQYGRLLAPTAQAEQRRERLQEAHRARWRAVKDARERRLSWPECYEEAAELLANSSARGGPDTMKRSYGLVQAQQQKSG